MPSKKFIFLLFLILNGYIGFSGDNDAILFLTTDPINCTVKIDNKKLSQKTPLLLTDIKPGQHRVEIFKKHFSSQKTVINIASGVNNSYSYRMTPYTSDELKINYPNQRYLDSLNIVIPVIAGFSAALTYNELSNPRYNDSLLSPFVISSYAVNTVFIAADIVLHIHKNRFIKKSDTFNLITEDISETVFNLGNKAFQEGLFDEALGNYQNIIGNYIDSPFSPASLYKSSLIYMIKNNYKDAESGFRDIIENYPEADLYDKSLKNLAEIYVIHEKYDKAVSLLKQILYVGDLYTFSEINARIEEILRLKNNTE